MWGCSCFPCFSGPGGFSLGWIFSILLWGLIILLFVMLAIKVYGPLRSGNTGKDKDRYDSLSILKMRYARGEISDEEFVRMKNSLL